MAVGRCSLRVSKSKQAAGEVQVASTVPHRPSIPCTRLVLRALDVDQAILPVFLVFERTVR
jgi:hypothetical protein